MDGSRAPTHLLHFCSIPSAGHRQRIIPTRSRTMIIAHVYQLSLPSSISTMRDYSFGSEPLPILPPYQVDAVPSFFWELREPMTSIQAYASTLAAVTEHKYTDNRNHL